MEETGLVIESVHGNVTLNSKTIIAGEDSGSFDVILLSTKAYHLEGAMESITQYVGKETIILPLLNGILHIAKLVEMFGEERVIGGLCFIETTLDKNGRIIQTSEKHDLVFGERTGERSERVLKMEDAFSGSKIAYRLSENINKDLWNKYLFISTMSGITTLLRAPIGPILEQASGRATITQLLKEIVSVMNRIEAPLPNAIETQLMNQINGLGYSMKSSMQRDMEKSLPVEADHLHGYLLEIARKEQISVPVLETVYANLQVYEQQMK